VVYRSDATGQSNGGTPAVGTEQNGVFFLTRSPDALILRSAAAF
jgi:hypothetical protein